MKDLTVSTLDTLTLHLFSHPAFNSKMPTLRTIPRTLLQAILYFGAFSRFTHGAYTPSFYAYQLDRAPDNSATRIIPVFDTVFGTLLFYPRARMWTAILCALGQGGGIVQRVGEGKDIVPD